DEALAGSAVRARYTRQSVTTAPPGPSSDSSRSTPVSASLLPDSPRPTAVSAGRSPDSPRSTAVSASRSPAPPADHENVSAGRGSVPAGRGSVSAGRGSMPTERDYAQRQSRILQARRRMLGTLLVLVAGAAGLAGTHLAASWVIIPPTAMLAGFV